MGLAFVAMSFLQLKEKSRPILIGVMFVATSVLAFGTPILQVYRHEDFLWQIVLMGMILLEAWSYMYIFANKARPFRPIGQEKKHGLLDRWLPDKFAPVSWGTNDMVATTVVIGGLTAWLLIPAFA